MRLIVTEKAIAGKRISDILAKTKITEKRSGDGPPAWEFNNTVVVPLSGHVMDVGFDDKYSSWKNTDVVDLAKAKIIYKHTRADILDILKKYAKKADELIIATDYDAEGESIGLEAITVVTKIKPKIKIKRALFSAITKEEIEHAFKNLKDFDTPLAHSADTRREVDLMWGATFTRFISKAAKKLGPGFLSVGRVQTPTLKLIVEKEKEREKFKSKKYWEVLAELLKGAKKIIASYEKSKIFDKKKVDMLLKLKGKAKILSVKKSTVTKQPPTPFNTTDYLRAASSSGLTASSAMAVAQSLYLKGLISYPRTDNTHYTKVDLRKILRVLSKVETIGKLADEINAKKTLEPTYGKKKTTDHPPIHPVAAASKDKLNPTEWRIYELIARRFLATLADPSKEERIGIKIDISGHNFKVNGLKILIPGWRRYYHYSKTKENILPELKQGDLLNVKKITSEEKETTPPARYGYGGIIKAMDELNLGTKATRPGILAKLVKRGYLTKGAQLIPSKVAMKVTEALEKHAKTITEPEMTANLEKEMAKVEAGKAKKDKTVDKSRKILVTVLKAIKKHKEKIGDDVRKGFYWDPLGKCPKCGQGEMRVIKSKKSGKRFIGCSRFPKCINGWPAPQRGRLWVLPELCKQCGLKKIMISYDKKRSWKVCLNLRCPSRKKKDVKKKKK